MKSEIDVLIVFAVETEDDTPIATTRRNIERAVSEALQQAGVSGFELEGMVTISHCKIASEARSPVIAW